MGTSVKHFAANNPEYKRFNGNSQVDERTLRELYLSAFETVAAANPNTVVVLSSGGTMPGSLMEVLLALANGHPVQGVRTMLRK